MTLEAPAPTWNFVSASLDAGDLSSLEPLFEELLQCEPQGLDELEHWLRDESELLSRISAEHARRYVAMTRHTEDEKAKQRYLSMEQEVLPRVKVLADRLDHKLLQSPLADRLDPREYFVLLRARRTAAEIFRPENTALTAEEAEVETEQRALMGSLTVPFDGEDRTLQQMAPYFEKADRDLRERAYMAVLATRRTSFSKLRELYDRLIRLRTQMGRNAGFDSYSPYRFKELGRFDYDQEDCKHFHDAVEQAVVPAMRRLQAERKRKLGIERLRPWDLEVDPDGRVGLRPFATEDELISICRKIFARVDPRFESEFALLQGKDLLDLMSRKGKAPGGYQYGFEDVRLPFIFANSVGTHRDVQTLLHEGGHSFHTILCRDHPLLAYRHAPIEFAETASMSMELMGLENLDAVYEAAAARAERRKHLEGILSTLAWVASIDAFQLQVYAHPEQSEEDRTQAWLALRARFAPELDWTGIRDGLENQWTSQGHLFTSPLYYIEYGIAQLAALQIWQRYREDPHAAVSGYREALALGGSRPLPELFEAAGVRFDLSEAMVGSLVAAIMDALQE